LTTFIAGPDKSLIRSGFWLVPTAGHKLADWYTMNPPRGMRTHGGPHAVSRSLNNDGSMSDEVYYDGLAKGQASHSAVLVQVTPVGDRAGVRTTVFSYWQPGRHPRSFAPRDTTSAKIVVFHDHRRLGDDHLRRSRKVTIVSKAEEVSELRRAYNSLLGTHDVPHSCPSNLLADTIDRRLTFIGPSRKVSAYLIGDFCGSPWKVTVDGKQLRPKLENVGLANLLDDLTP
jgi:hypothetical protein